MTRAKVRRLGAAGLVFGCLVALPGQASADDPRLLCRRSERDGRGADRVHGHVRGPVPEGGYTLAYSVTHGNTSNADFTGATSGNVGVAAEATTAKITLRLAQDARRRGQRNLHPQRGEGRRRSDTATGTINDNDAAPSATIAISC